MKIDERLYQSYMLRLWRESMDGDWRASLENITTGAKKNFSDLADMFVFLCGQVGQASRGVQAVNDSLQSRNIDGFNGTFETPKKETPDAE
jgi:hypothetical protein